MPSLTQPGTKGHHYIHFKVQVPTYVQLSRERKAKKDRLITLFHLPCSSLTLKQKELIEEWKKEEESNGSLANKLKGYFKR